MKKMKFGWRHQYDEVADKEEREETDVYTLEPSKTQQQFRDDVNLNTIVKRFGITDGAIPPGATDPRYFGDFSDAVDFRDSLDKTKEAIDRFNALPAEIRRQFDNNPIYLHDWIMNEGNAEEAVKLGLLKKREPVAPAPITVPATPTP